MSRANRGVRVVAGFAIVIGTMACSTVKAKADADLDRVLALLKQRQDQATVVRICTEGSLFMPKGGETEAYGALLKMHGDKEIPISPPQDLKVAKKQEFVIDYRGGRYWRAYQQQSEGESLESWVQSVDVSKSYGSKIDVPIERARSLRPTSMSVYSGGKQVDFFNSPWWPYFFSQEFILTNHSQKYYRYDLRPALDPEGMYALRREVFRGQTCVVVRTYPVGRKDAEHCYEYLIGIEDGAVRRMTDLWNGVRHFDITIDYRRQGDRIVPMRWTNESFVPKTQKSYKLETATVTLVELDYAAGEGLFTLAPEPGTVVTEKNRPDDWNPFDRAAVKTTLYQADESGRLVEGEIVNGEFKPRRRYLWWIGSGIGLLLLLSAATVWRIRRRGRIAERGLPPEPTGGTS